MQTPVNQLLLRFFNKENESMVVGESIYINDNLEVDHKMLDFSLTYSRPYSYPFKMTFTSAILCYGGTIKTVINHREYNVGVNDVLVVQSGSVVEQLTASDDMKIIAMAFDDKSMYEMFSYSTLDANAYIMHRSIPVLINIDDEEMDRHKCLYRDIRKFYMSVEPMYRSEVVKGYLYITTVNFLSNLKKKSLRDDVDYEHRREKELYLQFMDDLQLYGSKERTVSFYADRCCVSPKYFSKMIHRASGKAPVRLIKERVIIEATTLLNSTDMSIQQIADALNFPNDSFFCRYFKQEVKMSPMKYRTMASKK